MAIKLSGLASGLDTDSMVKELVSSYSYKLENYEKQKTKLEWKQEKWKDLNTKVYSFYTGSLSKMKLLSTFTNQKKCTVSDTTKLTASANNNVENGTQTVEISQLATSGYLTGSKISGGTSLTTSSTLSSLGLTAGGTLSFSINGETKTVDYTTDMKISDFTAAVKTATGLSANFDTTQQRFIFSSASGSSNDFTMNAATTDELKTLQSFGLLTEANINSVAGTDGSGKQNDTSAILTELGITDTTGLASKQAAQDAIITVNGAKFTNDSNTLTVNGLTVTATGITNGPVTITSSTDVDGIYSTIKSFLTDYNSIINTITGDYNADLAKGYEPLTDDEKDAMSDTEVENWENKIKTSLLRRDSTLESVMSTMTSAMSKGFEVNGKTYHLSSFGINTLGILNASDNEQNAYHIDGDSDDSSTADNKDKLKAALESDPDTVASFFNQMATKLYSSLTDKMKSTTMSSAYTIYNDKQMKEEASDLSDTIDTWEQKVSDYEDYWYSKFTSMETALAKLQSETSSLTSLLG